MGSPRRVSQEIAIYKGDTVEPLSFRITVANSNNGRDLSALTVQILMLTVTDDTGDEPVYSATPKIAQTASNVTAEPPKSCNVDTSGDWVLCNDHGFQDGWEVDFTGSSVKPTGLPDRGFVIDSYRNRFKVAEYEGGDAVDITTAGTSPSVFALGHVQYAWQSANVDTAGKFGFWAVLIDGSDSERVPPDEWGIRIVINEVETA